MGIVEASIFGIIQGLTEFLPVSSSGHLAVLKNIWGYSEVSILFDVLLHLATLIAVLIVFRRIVLELILSLYFIIRRLFISKAIRPELDKKHVVNLRLVGYLIMATLITAVLGLGVERILPAEPSMTMVGILFLCTAGILVFARLRPQGERGYSEMKPGDALFLGISQGLGVLPGISRSGITISTGMALGLRREDAGEFSFLLSIPAILGASVLKFADLSQLQSAVPTTSLVAGMVAGFVSGLLALILLMRLVRGGKLYLFSIYLIPLGFICIFLL